MPIFSKDGRRVYFAHIPKTAGSAVYVMFLRSGWAISNVETKRKKGRIGAMLHDEFGLTDIAQEGTMDGLRCPIQHAPASVWQTWGPFDDSFAIVREPYARYSSAVRYRYKTRLRLVGFDRFRRQILRALQGADPARLTSMKPHFWPQTAFVAPDTHILRYEDDWQAALAERYGLDARIEAVNRSQVRRMDLTADERATVARLHATDFARFGYDIDG